MPTETVYERGNPATWPPFRTLVCISVRSKSQMESRTCPAGVATGQILEASLYKALDGSPYWIVGRDASCLGPMLDDKWIAAWRPLAEERARQPQPAGLARQQAPVRRPMTAGSGSRAPH